MTFRSARAILLVFSIFGAGCAATEVPGATTAPSIEGPPARELGLPPASGADAREVKVLVDEPALKIVSIALRRGTVLPEHRSPVPVTIQAVSGSGYVTTRDARLRIDGEHLVLLAPNEPHAVVPDPDADLLLLVHHLRAR